MLWTLCLTFDNTFGLVLTQNIKISCTDKKYKLGYHLNIDYLTIPSKVANVKLPRSNCGVNSTNVLKIVDLSDISLTLVHFVYFVSLRISKSSADVFI